MKRKRKAKDISKVEDSTKAIDNSENTGSKMTRKNKRKKKGVSKGDNRSNTKPHKANQTLPDPFEPCDVTILKGFSDNIKAKEIQYLALHYLGCTQTQPEWCLVTNMNHNQKVCVVMVESMFPFIYRAMSLHMPHLKSIFPEGPNEIVNPGTELYVSPASSVILEKESKKRPHDSVSKEQLLPVQDYVLSLEQRMAHEYPLEDIKKDSAWKQFKGNITVAGQKYPLYAIDCEMCKTTEGMEATQIAIVDEMLNTVYKTYIKPKNDIVDYLTLYSGITPEILKDVTTTLSDIIKEINNLLPPQAIFIGHSLENDLKSLKLYHDKIIDTAVLYTSGKGGNCKPSLKFLASKYLKAKIQCSDEGHDPTEDAITCMRLVKMKIKNGPKFGVNSSATDNSLSMYLTKHKKTGVFIDKPIVVQQHCHGLAQSIPSTTDEYGIDTLLRRLSSKAEFFWLHLYKLEYIYKAGNTVHDMLNHPDLPTIISFIDESIKKIYNQLPGDTLFIVYSGCSGYWKKPEFNGSDEALKKLMSNIVQQIRRGLLFVRVKN